MNTITINGVTPARQPSDVEWAEEQTLGDDALKRPLVAPWRMVALTFRTSGEDAMTQAHYQEWAALKTNARVTVTVPSPTSRADTTYERAVVRSVTNRWSDINAYQPKVVIEVDMNSEVA